MHRQCSKMHKNEDIFVKQAQEFSPRLFYFCFGMEDRPLTKEKKKIPLFLIVLLFEKIYN